MTLFLTLLTGCSGCFEPSIPAGQPDPDPDTDEPPEETGETGDTDDTDIIDTGPPSLCHTEELEPNDEYASPQLLPMEEYACGGFERFLDVDWFTFTNSQPGWIRVHVESAQRGSSANSMFQVVGSDGVSAQITDSYLSTDPAVVFPVTSPTEFRIAMSETNFEYGEDYTWWLMASQVKAPVSWSFEETEPNDDAATSTVFPAGETVYGVIESASDFDWYHITTADEEANVTFRVEAFAAGSAANLKIVLYESDGVTEVWTDTTGEIDYDPDPFFERRVLGATDWYFLVRTEDGHGSRYHWYTLNITSTPTGSSGGEN